MALMPFAKNELIPKWNKRPRKNQPDCIVFHVGVVPRTLDSLHNAFSTRSDACSTAYVNNAGGVRQYQDSMQRSAGVRDGGERVFDVETAGGMGEDANAPWTAAQVESLARIAAWGHLVHKIPLRPMTSSRKSEKGIGFHRLGVQRSKWVSASAPGWLVSGGEKWSGAVGKVCPGPARITQIPQIIERAKEIVAKNPEYALGGSTPAAPAPKPPVAKPTPAPSKPASKPVTALVYGSKGAQVKKLQQGLNRVFPAYSRLAVDGSYGPATRNVIREFQRRVGIVVDGHCGPITQAHLKKYGVTL